MIYKNNYKIGMEDIGKNSQATDRALMAIMEDVACAHSASVGYGVLEVETKKRAWVLLDWQIKIYNRPKYGTEIEAYTWSREMDRLCAYRDFELKSESGQIFAAGTSRWLLTDTEKRRPVRLTEDIVGLYKSENKHVFENGMDKLEFSENKLKEAQECVYHVQRRDIDINSHMHNINYLDAAYEVLPQEVYENAEFSEIRIQYKKEIKPEDTVICRYFEDKGAYFVVMLVDDKIHSVVALAQ